MHRHNEIESDTISVSIGRHQIGPNHPLFVVAEAGVNHDGSLHKALDLIDSAVEAGADAVKFQMFRARELAWDNRGRLGGHLGRWNLGLRRGGSGGWTLATCDCDYGEKAQQGHGKLFH